MAMHQVGVSRLHVAHWVLFSLEDLSLFNAYLRIQLLTSCSGTWPEVLPWSSTTGPFSHFIVTIGGKEAGSAFGLEFPVLEEDCGDLGQVEVTIMGHLFGGATVSISKVVSVLRMDPRPVVAVEESRSIVSSLDM